MAKSYVQLTAEYFSTAFNTTWAISQVQVVNIANYVINNASSMSIESLFSGDVNQYINNIMIYPFNISNILFWNKITINRTQIYAGKYAIPNQTGYYISRSSASANVPNWFSAGWVYIEPLYNNWFDYLFKYQIYIPYKGYIDIDTSIILGSILFLLCTWDPASGIITMRLCATYDKFNSLYNAETWINNKGIEVYGFLDIIYECDVQVGQKMVLGSSNQLQAEIQAGIKGVTSAISIVGGVAAMAGGFAAGSVPAVVGGALATTHGLTNGLNSVLDYNKAHYSKGSANVNYLGPIKEFGYLRTSPYTVLMEDDNYDTWINERGAVANTTIAINTLHAGWHRCANSNEYIKTLRVERVSTPTGDRGEINGPLALPEDIKEIINILDGEAGFYIE